MPSRAIRGVAAGDVLATIISGLELLQATSNVASSVPLFSAIVGSALGLARTIEVRGP